MQVRYTPSLREQIAGMRAPDPSQGRQIVVRSSGHMVGRVDPVSRQCTGESQQFLKAEDGRLTILPKSQWVAEPDLIEVGYSVFR